MRHLHWFPCQLSLRVIAKTLPPKEKQPSRANIWKELICSPPKWIYLGRQGWLYLLKEISFSSSELSPSLRLCPIVNLFAPAQLLPHLIFPPFPPTHPHFSSFISISFKTKAPQLCFLKLESSNPRCWKKRPASKVLRISCHKVEDSSAFIQLRFEDLRDEFLLEESR